MLYRIALFLFILIFFSVPLAAAGVGGLMGNLITVVPDGPYDSGRNPALLPLLLKDLAIGYELSTIIYNSFDSTGDIDATFSGNTAGATAFSLDSPDTRGFNTALAIAAKQGKITYGFKINPRLTHEMPDLRYSISIPSYSLTMSANTEIESIEKETDAILSFAMLFTGNLSAGIQLSVQKKFTSNREYSSEYANGAFDSAGGKIDEERELNGSLALGFLYHTDAIQIGVVLDSGRYGWYRHVLSENKFPTDESEAYTVHGSTSWHARYSEGPSAVLGMYYKISPTLAFAIEGGYQLPVDSTNRVVSRAENSIEEIDADKEFKKIYFAGGGISFALFNSLVCAAGFQYFTSSFEETETNSVQHTDSEITMRMYRITAGADLKFSDSLHIVFYAAADIFQQTIEDIISETGMNMSMKLDITNTMYSAGIGVVQYF